MGFEIVLRDYTHYWPLWVAEGVSRWSRALAYRSITLAYAQLPPSTLGACEKGVGVINICDSATPIPGHWADGWQWDSGPWDGGYVHLYGAPPPDPEFAIAIVVHELGHNLGLKHTTDHPSVMTPVPSLAWPSSWDAVNAMPGYPMPVPPPVSPPAPEHKKKKRKHRKGGKH